MKDLLADRSLIEQMLALVDADGDIPDRQSADPHGFGSDAETTAYRIKKFIDEIPGGFLIYRADGDERILYANKALIRIFHCDSLQEFRELTGNSFRGIVHPDDLDAVEKSIAEQIENSRDDLDYVEYRIAAKNGEIRWVEDYGHFIHSKTGDIFYVFISDATEKVTRLMVERAALASEKRENEQKLQNLIEEYDKERKLIRQEHLQRLEVIEGLSVNYESILYADLDTDTVLPYRLSSRLEQQFEQKLQARGLSWYLHEYAESWIHPEDKALFFERTAPQYIKSALAQSPTYYLNYRCIQDGEPKFLQLRIVNVGAKEKIEQVVMGTRSIDEEVLQQLKQKQLLEDALRTARLAEVAKNTFLSNMSHDMRTPLNAIFGYASLAGKNLNDPQAVREYLGKIETAGTQMLDLIAKVLEFSYTESQECRITETRCDLSATLREVYEAALPQAEKKKLNFSLSPNPPINREVSCDGEKLKQLLTHLVNNAIQFTEPEGSVTLTVAEESTLLGEYVTYRFRVEDTGIGIRQDDLERIFEPFERVGNTTASGKYGSGLGLTIAKRIAERMGGELTVKSEYGKGSVFTLILCFRLLAPEASAPNDLLPAALVGKKVLLAEDNEINLEIETELLQDLGFTVDTAVNGKIAVEKLKNAPPEEYALVVTDIQMPVMDGREAAQLIRKFPDPARAEIPIIAVSANAFESDKRLSLEAGINAHLTKPIDIPILLKAIGKIFRTEQ